MQNYCDFGMGPGKGLIDSKRYQSAEAKSRTSLGNIRALGFIDVTTDKPRKYQLWFCEDVHLKRGKKSWKAELH